MSLHDDVVQLLEVVHDNMPTQEFLNDTATKIIALVKAGHRAEIAYERRVERDKAYQRGREDADQWWADSIDNIIKRKQ